MQPARTDRGPGVVRKLALNWVCFFGPSGGIYSCNHFMCKRLCSFGHLRNWVCFFESRHTQYALRNTKLALFFHIAVFRMSTFELRASGQSPANWLCFFILGPNRAPVPSLAPLSFPRKRESSLFELRASAFRPKLGLLALNWVCFFGTSNWIKSCNPLL